jgi:hypothetical protein
MAARIFVIHRLHGNKRPDYAGNTGRDATGKKSPLTPGDGGFI